MKFSKRVTAVEAIRYELERERKSMNMRLNSIVLDVVEELERAQNLFPSMCSEHHGYAVIKEELEELWDSIKRLKAADSVCVDQQDERENMKEEATQVAAMAIRFIYDLCKEGE